MSYGDAFLGAWVDPDLRQELDQLAYNNERSRSAEIRIALAKHLRANTDLNAKAANLRPIPNDKES